MNVLSQSRFVPGVAAPEDTGDVPALWFLFRERALLVHDRDTLVLSSDPAQLGLDIAERLYIGRLGDHHCFAAALSRDAEAPPDTTFADLRTLFGRFDEPMFALAGRAVQLVDWDRTHRFCGQCGTQTEPSPQERSRRCPRCRLIVFPRLAPAVIVAVERGDEILLARSRGFPPGFYSVPAGFVEPGESLEQTVAREIEEETGILVDDVRYFASQPWPFPHSLMVGFTACFAGGELRVDPVELEDAAFFHADAMPPFFRGRISIAGWLIEDFLKRRGRG